MAISNLTGTTWLINSTPNPNIFMWFSLTFRSNNTDFAQARIIQDGPEKWITYCIDNAGTLDIQVYYWYNDVGSWSDESYRTIQITGGTDATNSTLITWLEANATQILPPQTLATILFSVNTPPYALVPVNIVQKKLISSGSGITNLTGTTWLFNDDLGFFSWEYTFNINFTSNSTNYTILKPSHAAGSIMYRLNSSDIPGTEVYFVEGTPNPGGVYGWQLEAYRTITITGGADATNATLISWLQTAATFVSGDSLSPARLLPTIPPTTFISFTISGVIYEAEEGMTWYEWVNSEYNTNGYTCTNVNDYVMRSNAHITVNNNFVYGYDIILENQEYV